MITIKTANYTIPQLSALRAILHDGLTDLMGRSCVGDCKECLYQYLCNDIELTEEFLNKKIEEMKRQYGGK